MAKVTNAFTTFSAKGNREDLANTIYNIDPTDTPVLSTIAGKRNVTNVIFDWQTESLPAVSTSVDLEGYTLSNAAATPTVRQSNTCQIMHRDATVSRTQDAADAAGKTSEMARQLSIMSKALKRDMETAICSSQAKVSDSDGTTARKTRGLESWISTNVSHGTGGSTNASTGVVTNGTNRTFTQTLLEDMLQSAWTAGAEPNKLLLGPAAKRKLSAFSGRSGTQVVNKQSELVVGFDIYSSDFGQLTAMPSRFSSANTVFLLDPSYVKVAYYRNFESYDIATIGSAKTKVLEVEFGVEVSNEAAHAKIADLTP